MTSRVAPPAWWRRPWPPAVAVVVLAVVLARVHGQVEVADVLRFAVYVAGWLVLPGVVAWRLVDPRQRDGPRPLGEDLALGALLGVVLEFPAFLLCTVVGAPGLYLAWPLVWFAVLVSVGRRRDVLHLGAVRAGRSWASLSALLLCYPVVWFARTRWAAEPATDTGLSRSYADEYFHLGIVAALRRAFPPEYLQVAGTPVEYHWLSHLHVAAASRVTGVEPAVLLHTLSIPTVVVLAVVGLSRVAVRLTGASWTGPVTLLAVVTTSAAFVGWRPAPSGMITLLNVVSPSAGFAHAATVLALLLLVEALRGPRLSWRVVLTLAVVLVAAAGAKSTSLPPLVAGLGAATLVGVARDRALPRRPAALTALGLACFVVATGFFVGFDSSQGLALGPLHLAAEPLFAYLPPGTVEDLLPRGAAAGIPFLARAVAATALLGYAALAIGMLCLLLRGGWRRPESVFLATSVAAGLAASLILTQIGLSQRYFAFGMLPTLVLGAVLGVHRACAGLTPRPALTAATPAALGGLVVGCLLVIAGRRVPAPPVASPELQDALLLVAAPVAVSLVSAAVLAVAVPAALRRWTGPSPARRLVPLTAMSALAGLGLVYPASVADDTLRDPVPAPASSTPFDIIGEQGIPTARWVREHLPDDAVLATNAHCLFIGESPPCSSIKTWMSAYTERPFLVEGWAFLSWSLVGREQPEDLNTVLGPFWDPATLAANDAAFLDPSPAALEELRERHGVGWLLVDRRYAADLERLRPLADVVHEQGDYVVLRLP